MDAHLVANYDSIPFPARGNLALPAELLEFQLPETQGFANGQFTSGICLSQAAEDIPETALASLRRLLRHRNIAEQGNGIPLRITADETCISEEFDLNVSPSDICLAASDKEGIRRGIYAFEELLASHDSQEPLRCHAHRKPYIKHRITRNYFTPNSRPPLALDELESDFDYYPEPYLDRLAHQGMNAIWITLYLCDVPSRFFPGQGAHIQERLARLQATVDRCARYGIKCFLFMAEPRGFRKLWKSFRPEDAASHPGMTGHTDPGITYFCTSTQEGKAYLDETLDYVFSHVHGLGGVINIMCQEASAPCALWRMFPHIKTCNCPRCSKRSAAELFAETAQTMGNAIRRSTPDAEFIGWFYAASYIPDSPENEQLLDIARHWPKDMTLMRNCETGGRITQCGRERVVQDYSLSYARASQDWLDMARLTPHPAAKIQTGCSHEDATVPYLPVPGNLYRIYDDIRKTSCQTVMQGWYFGNYPSLMTQAAGRLSFLPFPKSEQSFLEELARPLWGTHAPQVAQCWMTFGEAYRNFPENLPFKWFGPLHHSIVFPWHLFPADLPMAPSYTQGFPKNSGDRIGECIGYSHDFAEIRELLTKMDRLWQDALRQYLPLARTPRQQQETRLAEAIGLQIASSWRLFQFYHLREHMIYTGTDHRTDMADLVRKEISATRRMLELTRLDSRLGYHSEVESYLFFPEKLQARIQLLQNLLEHDFPAFDPNADDLKRYTGELKASRYLLAGPSPDKPTQLTLDGTRISVFLDQNILTIQFEGIRSRCRLDLEPGRLCQIMSYQFAGIPGEVISTWGYAGVTVHRGPQQIRFDFDLLALAPFRQHRTAPMRINFSCGEEALIPRHLLPARLCQGDTNPQDLMFLYLEPQP